MPDTPTDPALHDKWHKAVAAAGRLAGGLGLPHPVTTQQETASP